mmetsp:Transcript_82066/g.211478  ORF Transcript_82066/g.211478 Transcript_82066/m.211478 type:complete len:316 (+) Transcript_82066:156-1103(+)
MLAKSEQSYPHVQRGGRARDLYCNERAPSVLRNAPCALAERLRSCAARGLAEQLEGHLGRLKFFHQELEALLPLDLAALIRGQLVHCFGLRGQQQRLPQLRWVDVQHPGHVFLTQAVFPEDGQLRPERGRLRLRLPRLLHRCSPLLPGGLARPRLGTRQHARARHADRVGCPVSHVRHIRGQVQASEEDAGSNGVPHVLAAAAAVQDERPPLGADGHLSNGACTTLLILELNRVLLRAPSGHETHREAQLAEEVVLRHEVLVVDGHVHSLVRRRDREPDLVGEVRTQCLVHGRGAELVCATADADVRVRSRLGAE